MLLHWRTPETSLIYIQDDVYRTVCDSNMNDSAVQRSPDSDFCSSLGAALPLHVEFIWISSAQVKALNCLQVGSVMQ